MPTTTCTSRPTPSRRFLPDEYKNVIKYVQVNGRDKLAIKNVISEYIPNPTFTVVARPGAQEEFFKNGNPEGKSRREILGEPDPPARCLLPAPASPRS